MDCEKQIVDEISVKKTYNNYAFEKLIEGLLNWKEYKRIRINRLRIFKTFTN